jgi:hypothetical protein
LYKGESRHTMGQISASLCCDIYHYLILLPVALADR